MPRSRTAKFMHMFYILVIAVLLTLLFVERQQHTAPLTREELSTELERQQDVLNAHIERLHSQTEQQFTELATRFERQQQPASITSSAPASSQNPPVNQLETPTEAAADTSTRSMQSVDYAQLGAAMTNDFDARQREFSMQSVDPDWADPSRALIRDALATSPATQALSIAGLECRSSICQLDVSQQNPDSLQPAQILQALQTINQNEQGLRYQFAGQPLDDSYRVLVIRSQSSAEANDTDD